MERLPDGWDKANLTPEELKLAKRMGLIKSQRKKKAISAEIPLETSNGYELTPENASDRGAPIRGSAAPPEPLLTDTPITVSGQPRFSADFATCK